MKIANYPDFFAGLFFLLFGGLAAYLSTAYNMGTGARMGPGYFPYWLGIILAVIGGIVLIKSLGKTAGARASGLMRPIMIFGAMMLFSLLIGWLGGFSPNASLAIGTVAGCTLAYYVGMPSMGLILFSITVFGLLLKGVGLFVATTALVVIASAASHEFNKKNLTVGLVVGAILGFIALMVVIGIHKGGMDAGLKGMGTGIIAGAAIGVRLLVLGAIVGLLIKLPAAMIDGHTKQFAGVLAFLVCLGPWVFVDGLKLQMPTWPDQEELVRMFKTDAKKR